MNFIIVSIIFIPELKAIFLAYFKEKESVSPIIKVLKPPFADEHIEKLAEKVDNILVVEINSGQVTREVQRAVKGKANVHGVLKHGGAIHTPEEILSEIERRVK